MRVVGPTVRIGERYHFTRTVVARTNSWSIRHMKRPVFINLDAERERLNSGSRYEVTFAADTTSPVDGLWSLSAGSPLIVKEVG